MFDTTVNTQPIDECIKDVSHNQTYISQFEYYTHNCCEFVVSPVQRNERKHEVFPNYFRCHCFLLHLRGSR